MARIRGFRDLPHLSEQDKQCLVCWRNEYCHNYRKTTNCHSFRMNNPYPTETNKETLTNK